MVRQRFQTTQNTIPQTKSPHLRLSQDRLRIPLHRLKGGNRQGVSVRRGAVGCRFSLTTMGRRGTRKKRGSAMGITTEGKERGAPRGNRMGCWVSCRGKRAGRGVRNRWKRACWGKKGPGSWLVVDKTDPYAWMSRWPFTHGTPPPLPSLCPARESDRLDGEAWMYVDKTNLDYKVPSSFSDKGLFSFLFSSLSLIYELLSDLTDMFWLAIWCLYTMKWSCLPFACLRLLALALALALLARGMKI